MAVGGANFAYTQSQVGANSDQIDTLESTISTLRNTINQLQTDVTSLQSTQAVKSDGLQNVWLYYCCIIFSDHPDDADRGQAQDGHDVHHPETGDRIYRCFGAG